MVAKNRGGRDESEEDRDNKAKGVCKEKAETHERARARGTASFPGLPARAAWERG